MFVNRGRSVAPGSDSDGDAAAGGMRASFEIKFIGVRGDADTTTGRVGGAGARSAPAPPEPETKIFRGSRGGDGLR